MYRKYIKRLLDIICSLFAITLLSPVLIIVSILVHIKLGSPIIFKQQRVGKNEKIFTMYKFRTMTDERDQNGCLLPNEARFTKFGSILRATSLDELPELINILNGDISIVGPRSLLVEYLPYYTECERQRHKVRGGLTPPEVLYDNITPTWEKQFEYEVHYANNVSFMLDVRIMFATIKGVFKRNSVDYGNYVRASFAEERKNSYKDGTFKPEQRFRRLETDEGRR